MTKVTIANLGLQEEKKELKPIEFLKYNTFTHDEGKWMDKDADGIVPSYWANISLIQKNWRRTGMDLMIAFDSNGSSCLYLGHFNDGIV